MCCNPQGNAGGALTPLPNTFWVQEGAPGTGGTPATSGSASAFPTFTAAVAALAVGSARLFVVQGDYSNSGIPEDPSAAATLVSIEGVGGSRTSGQQAALPPLILANEIQGVLRNVQVTPDGGLQATLGWQTLIASECNFVGNVDVVGAIVADSTTFVLGSVVTGGDSNFRNCDAGGGNPFATPIARLDLASFINFGNRGVTRVDGANDAEWLLSTPSPAAEVRYAALQDADRALVFDAANTTGGVWCSRNSLSANRAVTVNVAGAPANGLFRVYNFGQLGSGATLTVAGVLCPDFMLTTLQLQGGVLTLLSTEFI